MRHDHHRARIAREAAKEKPKPVSRKKTTKRKGK